MLGHLIHLVQRCKRKLPLEPFQLIVFIFFHVHQRWVLRRQVGVRCQKINGAYLIELFTLISVVLENCENSKYFLRYHAKHNAKMTIFGPQNRLKQRQKWPLILTFIPNQPQIWYMGVANATCRHASLNLRKKHHLLQFLAQTAETYPKCA